MALIMVAKNYVHSDEPIDSTIELRRKMILEDRQNFLRDVGSSFSWEQVKDMAKNKEKRNGL
jgi:hypothetical protein